MPAWIHPIRNRREAADEPADEARTYAGYRTGVGPPDSYDVIAAGTFGLLTALGLRGRHQLLDIGCGSLRNGRLLIPYLEAGNYVGIEPQRWLVEAGIQLQVGADLVRLKRPRFHYESDGRALKPDDCFDFALAQSIFSHTGPDLLAGWLQTASSHLNADGALVATFVPGADSDEHGWVYMATYSRATITRMAADAGLSFQPLAWLHPAQRWALFAKPAFDDGALELDSEAPHWNRYLDRELNRNTIDGTPVSERMDFVD
jgi:hypothetical protein